MVLDRLSSGSSRSKRRDAVIAFVLACASWLVLTPIWIHASQGGWVDRVIGGLFYLPYRAGKHFAHVVFPNDATRNTTGYYAAPLMGVAGEVLFLMVLWFVSVRIWNRIRNRS
jgi:hypothetical protein